MGVNPNHHRPGPEHRSDDRDAWPDRHGADFGDSAERIHRNGRHGLQRDRLPCWCGVPADLYGPRFGKHHRNHGGASHDYDRYDRIWHYDNGKRPLSYRWRHRSCVPAVHGHPGAASEVFGPLRDSSVALRSLSGCGGGSTSTPATTTSTGTGTGTSSTPTTTAGTYTVTVTATPTVGAAVTTNLSVVVQ
jgi:hypothetical protein